MRLWKIKTDWMHVIHTLRSVGGYRSEEDVTCRAEALLRTIIYGEVPLDGNAVILEGQMSGLVPLVVGAAQSHRGEQVKAYLTVGLWVLDRCALLSRFELVCIKAWDRLRNRPLPNVDFPSVEIRRPHSFTPEKPLALGNNYICSSTAAHSGGLHAPLNMHSCLYMQRKSWMLHWLPESSSVVFSSTVINLTI